MISLPVEDKTTILRVRYLEWSALFRYPFPSLPEIVTDIHEKLRVEEPAVADTLSPFVEFVTHTSLPIVEEVYLRTFELQALTTLDMGYHLFGEDYKRGSFLAHLQEEYKIAKVGVGNQLPDNIVPLLVLIAHHPEVSFLTDFVPRLLLPALSFCMQEFEKSEEKHRRLRERGETVLEVPSLWQRIYRYPLLALFQILENDFGEMEPLKMPVASSSFFCSLQKKKLDEGVCSNECSG